MHINNNSKIVIDFHHLINEYSLKILNDVNIPTHEKGNTLDLIISSQNLESKLSNIMVHNDFKISDHYPVSIKFNIIKQNPDKKLICYKDYKNINYVDIGAILQMKLYDKDLFEMSVEDLSTYYNEILFEIQNTIPDKRFYLRTDKEEPWYNGEVNLLRKERRRKERQYKKNKSIENKEILNNARNQLTYKIRHSKQNYLQEKIQSNKHNTKHLFKLIYPLVDKSQMETPFAAESHSLFFTEKIKKIEEEIQNRKIARPINRNSPLVYNVEAFNFNNFVLVSEYKIFKIISKMKVKSSTLDPIDTKFVKNDTICKIVAPYLSVLVNKSLQEGYFPETEKVGIITPIVKPNKDPNNINNYRPITSLTFLSKLLENVVHEQIINYLNTQNLLPKFQSAYRYQHSTTTALLKIQNDIINILAKGETVIYISLDLSAAFDTILHSHLLKCLQNFGIIDIPLKWFNSYLNNRKIKVKAKNMLSGFSQLLIGIPQGGVLSPTLYSIYISDICLLLDKHDIHYHLYADDIIIYFTTKNLNIIEAIQHKINILMDEIETYMLFKHLKLNSEKTEIIHINNNSRVNLKFKFLNINDNCIKIKTSIKSIGYIIDNELNMKEQISSTIKKCNYALHCISKIRQYLDNHSTQVIINALVISKLEYNLELLYNINQREANKLEKVLKRCVRLIFKLKKRDSVQTYMKKLNWLPILERIKLKKT